MLERKFQTQFLKWAKHQSKLYSAALELKISNDGVLPHRALKEHQVGALLAAKHNRIAHKIADDSVGFKPFDCFVLREVPAFVVVYFWSRGEKKFYMIDIDDWVLETKTSERKSLTKERAAEIGQTCLLDKDGCTPPLKKPAQ